MSTKEEQLILEMENSNILNWYEEMTVDKYTEKLLQFK